MRLSYRIGLVVLALALGAGGWLFKDRLLPTDQPRGMPGAGGPEGAQRPLMVEMAKARTAEISTVVEAVGTALANESVTITAKTAGLVRHITFQEGQRVAAGAVLLELDSAEIEAKLAETRAARDNARVALNRAKALLTTKNVPEARVDELQAQFNGAQARVQAEQAKLDDMTIRAPFAGRLGLRQVSIGALIKPGDVITTLDDASVIKVDFQVPETELSGIAPGQTLAATSAAMPGRPFSGTIATLDSRIDPVTRSVRIRATIANSDDALKPGMFMTVRLTTGRIPDALVIAEEAVLTTGSQHFVFLVKDGRAMRTRVRLGQRMPGVVQVLEGLTINDQVIVGGLLQVRDGMPVRPVVKAGPGIAGPAGKPQG